MKQFHHIKRYAAILLMLAAMGACTEEEQGNTPLAPAEEDITFLGSVKETKGIATRSEDYIIINEQDDGYGEMDFYIYQQIDSETPTIQIYNPSGGDQGRLETQSEREPLKWKSTTASHLFYAWTQPNVTDETTQDVTGGVKMDEVTGNTYPTTGTVIFGTEEKTKLDHFIVTKQGSLTYDENNQYVGLHFYHPVSKIVIDNIIHFRQIDESTEPIKKCTLTFPNLYKQATFTATKATDENNAYSEVLDAVENEKGITWEWREDDPQTYLYVLPFDFEGNEGTPYYEQPGYFIVNANVMISGKETNLSYTGTLVGSDPDITGVKGNQELHISMQITDGVGTGIGSRINEWTDDEEIDIPQHRVPGIYTQADAEALLEGLQSDPVKIPPYLIDIDEGNNTKTIRFFTHVDWSEATDDITIPDGYVLDGQGYKLTLPEGMNLYGVKGEGEDEAGNIKNLYVNEDEDEYTVVEEPEPEPEPDPDPGTPGTEDPTTGDNTANT